MPFVGYVNMAEVVIRSERDGNERVTVLHYFNTAGDMSLTSLTYLANQVASDVAQKIAALVCIGTTVQTVTATDLSEEAGTQHVTVMNFPGTGGSDVLPANVAALILKKTARAGRAFTGRLYCYDLSEDLFNGSTLNDLTRANLDSLAGSLDDVIGGDWIPVVYSRTRNDYAQITAGVVQSVAATMRRRLPGRGS